MRLEHLRLAGVQGAITIIGATVAYAIVTPLAAKSVAYGSGVAMLGTLFLAWRLVTGKRHEHIGAERVLRHAYRTAIERFLLVVSLLIIGLEYFKLAPLELVAGFVAGQLAWLAIPIWAKLRT
jgi:F0F1-type ATP synthase assembly protein I